MASPSFHMAISFQVKRCEPELVIPATPTPREDNPTMDGIDPVKVIREVLGRALVYYYPLAGRLMEESNNNLMVDCNGQGVLFIESDTDVKLHQLDHPIRSPFPFLDQILYNVPGSDGILGCPLLLIQVTRLKCGDFILTIRMNHPMFDGFGVQQFLNALTEMARGAKEPSIAPVWQREFLNNRNPPRITCVHNEFDENMTDDQLKSQSNNGHLKTSSSTLSYLVTIRVTNSLRMEMSNICTEFGFSRGCSSFLPVQWTSQEHWFESAFRVLRQCVCFLEFLCKCTMGYAVELVKKVKSEMNAEYIRSAIDFIVIKGRPRRKIKGNLIFSDITNAGLGDLDFGWGYQEYGGPAMSFPLISFMIKFKNNGEDGIMVLTSLPLLVVERLQVSRCKPELLVPAKPTPCEVKKLSDIDNQLRNQIPEIWFYKNNNNEYPSIMEGKDPVKVIREALSRALVYYYPLAGRVKEGNDGKLVVDCNGKGVLFVEAEADFKLEQLGHAIQPPFPFLNEVLYNVPGSDDILDRPLLLIQVTRLICGGFILAVRLNHTMCDASGLCQFMNTVGEIAQGAKHPTILPVWQRELLNARNPPQITRTHHEFREEMADDQLNMDLTDLVLRQIVINHNHIMAIRKHLRPHLATCSRFVLLTACLWRCRTIALDLDPEHVVQVSCAFNGRGKNTGLNLPLGYYGNVVVFPAAVSKAGDLFKKPLEYAVELVKNLKSEMNAEYIKSVADLTVIRGRPTFKIRGNFFVSDITKVGLGEVNFGWGYPEYAGTPLSYPRNCHYINHRNKSGDGILVPLCLPSLAMVRFQQELKKIIEVPNYTHQTLVQPTKIVSKF
ncbi:hypothetical protein FNV43_RR10346 [Rhamnella rubrinervis]|uniref:Methanol O-anthraniloyltransferase-like n=1 Tax=Rhamnella rubrinervis TaxID=2594499 RepID=A0A8K0ML86_9ROSA|nr:hypothetical protein FNV43_RR10346 [Rhamnella rubrinervis]